MVSAITTIDVSGTTETITTDLSNGNTLDVIGTPSGGTLIDTGTLRNGSEIENQGAVVEATGTIFKTDLDFVGTTPGTYDLTTANIKSQGETITGMNSGDIVALNETFNGASYDAATDTLTLTQNGTSVDAISVTLAAGASADFTFGSIVLNGTTLDYFENTICFAAGTHIATPAGEVPVERLAIGDHVLTSAGKAKPVRWIGHGCHLISRPRIDGASPVIVRAGALGDGSPRRDLRLTKGHSLYLDGVLIPVEFLVNHRSILWDDRPQVIDFYHVELEDHDLLLAEGAPAESYRDDGNRQLFANTNPAWDAGRQIPPCAPVLTSGPEVEAVWQRLSDRAGPVAALTHEHDLHIVADGVRVDAATAEAQVYRFELPATPASLRVKSRHVVPAAVGLNPDQRQLGVALRRIVLSAGGTRMELGYDSACLADGFDDPEPVPGFRWTSGEATIPARALAAFDGPLTVVLEVGCTAMYPPDETQSEVRLIA